MRAKVLRNGWLEIAGRKGRLVPRDGFVSKTEAATALGTYYMRICRLIAQGKLKAVAGPGRSQVIPASEIRRVLKRGLAQLVAMP